MLALSLISLFVFIFSAYAYGATTVLALRATPLWARAGGSSDQPAKRIDPVLLALCGICTIWFILAALFEFRELTGQASVRGVTKLLTFLLSYAFPPLIMHTVLNETAPECFEPGRRRQWMRPIWAMYVLSALAAGYLLAAWLDLVPRPQPFDAWSGASIGLLFTLCSIYCLVAIARRPGGTAGRSSESAQERGLRRTMSGLFLIMIVLVAGLSFYRDQYLLTEAMERATRALPIFFLVTSVYFENRFEFYDLIVKRAAVLLASLLFVGVFLSVALGMLDQLPGGIARPWLFAVALLPIALVLPWLNRALGRWLDRMWFGREFTPVEAVNQVLSAMQPATDESALVQTAESRLSEMFHRRVHILLGDTPPPPAAVVEMVSSTGRAAAVRIAIMPEPGARPLLSEDMSLLRSLVGVFGHLLENIRLQRRRQEQDLVAQELRLQNSRSELKALRAQINPHFLFNALNAIASLIHTDPARADAAVEQLAEVFRYTLRRSEQEWAPLDQELAFARAYLDVEQARSGRRLAFSITADPSANGSHVPGMLLHTLVENAVKHGISQTRGAGRIDIRATAQGGTLVMEVSDTGPGPDHAARTETAGEGFGLRSVRDRLHGHFGANASLTLTRDPDRGITLARIEMPLIRDTVREAALVREGA